MGVLQTVARTHVQFDPDNKAHRAAFWVLRKTGKQNEQLRFVLEEGYGSVLTMMQDKLACHFSRPDEASEKPWTMLEVVEGMYNKDRHWRIK